jgi:hypothetical protein
VTAAPPGSSSQLQYDTNGNLVHDGRTGLNFSYNAENRLNSVNGNGVLVDYKHNALGQRVLKVGATPDLVHTHFHYGVDGTLLAETDSIGGLQREYIYADDMLLAVILPDATSDSDGDGMDDEWELQHFGSLNRNGNGDLDADGLSDLGEFNQGLSPVSRSGPDIDSDGLPDFWEYQYFGGVDANGDDDHDQDGSTNIEEYVAGSDPTEAGRAWLSAVLITLLN